VTFDYWISQQNILVMVFALFKSEQVLSLACLSYFFHRINSFALILQCNCGVNQRQGITTLFVHDLAEQHELECFSCSSVKHRSVPFESLIEIGVCSIVIVFITSNQTRHVVDLSLKERNDIDGIGGGLD